MKKLLVLSIFLLPFWVSAQQSITADQAASNIGKKMTVCGKVVSTKFLSRSKGQPTLLNLDKPFPNQIFTVLIWGSDRNRFKESPEDMYNSKTICVTGLIKEFKGKPEVIVNDPEQIKIK